MIINIEAAIPLSVTNHCIQRCEENILRIRDDENQWCVVVDEEPFHFLIKNPDAVPFYFMAIDKCCLNHKFVGRRCDFGIIIENHHLFLIEIKNTTEDERKKADPIAQIENTIKFFDRNNLLADYAFRTAVLCWKIYPPMPITDSSYNTAKFRFAKNYRFSLKEGNSVTISNS